MKSNKDSSNNNRKLGIRTLRCRMQVDRNERDKRPAPVTNAKNATREWDSMNYQAQRDLLQLRDQGIEILCDSYTGTHKEGSVGQKMAVALQWETMSEAGQYHLVTSASADGDNKDWSQIEADEMAADAEEMEGDTGSHYVHDPMDRQHMTDAEVEKYNARSRKERQKAPFYLLAYLVETQHCTEEQAQQAWDNADKMGREAFAMDAQKHSRANDFVLSTIEKWDVDRRSHTLHLQDTAKRMRDDAEALALTATQQLAEWTNRVNKASHQADRAEGIAAHDRLNEVMRATMLTGVLLERVMKIPDVVVTVCTGITVENEGLTRCMVELTPHRGTKLVLRPFWVRRWQSRKGATFTPHHIRGTHTTLLTLLERFIEVAGELHTAVAKEDTDA